MIQRCWRDLHPDPAHLLHVLGWTDDCPSTILSDHHRLRFAWCATVTTAWHQLAKDVLDAQDGEIYPDADLSQPELHDAVHRSGGSSCEPCLPLSSTGGEMCVREGPCRSYADPVQAVGRHGPSSVISWCSSTTALLVLWLALASSEGG